MKAASEKTSGEDLKLEISRDEMQSEIKYVP